MTPAFICHCCPQYQSWQHLLHQQSESLQAVQKLVAAALVEVQSRQGGG